MQKKTAILFGATGLTGSLLLTKLIQDERYEKVKVFTRSVPDAKSDKLQIINTDLDNLENYSDDISGHDLFCCLGTTIKKAGTKENFRKVDLEWPALIAKTASKNGIPNFLMISSIGANPESSNFYLRTKGEAENAVRHHKFNKIVILRPSMLLGKRNEFRFFEEMGKLVMAPLKFVFRGKLKKYRPIDAERVARAMVKFANITTSKTVFESHEIELFTKN
ncbi:MAG: oxidoreductase [Marinilabiliales bacterium]|nr:MAG: oxidoreductase [Marinilabiliales bacterium]